MKKYLLVLLVIICSIGAKAQFTLGVKGGINFSKINTDNVPESTITGYQFGAWARIGKGFYLQPEIYIGSQGGQFNFQTQNNTAIESGSVRFTTLDVPVLIGKSFGLSNLNVRVMAGPIYSYLLNKNENFSNNITNAYTNFGNYSNSTLGYQVGAGVDIGNISLDARYEGGLTQINQKYGQRENLWHISLGFKIL